MPWAPYPSGDEVRPGSDDVEAPDPSAVGAGVDDYRERRVVGLGATCDLSSTGNDDRRQYRFDVSEFAVLDDGRRVVLHNERGFTAATNGDDIWAHATADDITGTVLAVVLPDDAETTGEDHPWERLAELLRARGVDVEGGQLRALPYEVVLTDRVLDRLPERP